MFTIRIRDVIAFGSNDNFNGENPSSSSLLLLVFSVSPSSIRLAVAEVRRRSVVRRLSVGRSANGISWTGFSVTGLCVTGLSSPTGFGWKSVLRA